MPTRRDYLVGLDLGSSVTRCIVAIEEDSRLRFIAHGVAALEGGWKRGVISDQEPVLDSIERAVEAAERNGGMTVDAAVVGVGGPHVRSNVCKAGVALNSWEQEVEQRHVDDVVKRAAQGPLGEDRTVLQAVPLEFSVDQVSGKRNPLGMAGQRLDAHVQVVSAHAQAHDNIRAVVNRAGVVAAETISEGFAAAYAVLEEQERELGVVTVDIGAGSTEIACYLDNDLRLVAGLPIGGEHFASDVASVLRTSREAAANLIEQYGSVLPEQTPENSMIAVPSVNSDDFVQQPRRLLGEVLSARAEEIFELIGRELRRAGLEGRLVGGAVLTGSVACLAGACDLAEHVLDSSARIGLPPRLEDLPDELDHPGWATGLGLVLYAQRLKVHQRRRKDRVTEWLKTLFE